ncbi:gamma-glutamyltransferase [Oceanobacter sp. 4_MG-2023]|uniref:gamma-glutamyltransferase n=1 Tax=Oceanobacter sp. 4_MG-2023 TaxID=3062623 RepID=UPI002736511C|nr:gamma-glutamyltransferase [Oceanobacter sp. 4_MG-2023]MDP2548616.1 gamma-glutamyltransferase [Oceanobacter sp. 4_MG-2023]
MTATLLSRLLHQPLVYRPGLLLLILIGVVACAQTEEPSTATSPITTSQTTTSPATTLQATAPATPETTLIVRPQPPGSHAIASAHPLATQAGMDILNAGGNAIDAAIAVAASLGVVEPYSAGIGGGGFWLLYLADRQQYRFVDAREQAPLAAHRDYYLDEQGNVIRDKAINGPTAAAIPGQAAAFHWLAEQYGHLPLSTSLHAAIQQARDGFAVYPQYRKLLNYRLKTLQRYPDSARLFLSNGKMPAVGHLIQQPELAITLERLASQGHDGFYRGPTAAALVKGVQAAGGDWTLQDLENYQVIERQPITATLGEYTLISAPPPSSGGIALTQMLTMLAQFPWRSMDQVQQTHLLAEVMRRAYHDRAKYLGDPDVVDVPTQHLMSTSHNRQWADGIRLDRATPSISLAGPKNIEEGFHTTHLSVLDAHGNMVSATLSINLPFGSAFTVPGTGVLLNNEMDDFSAKPGAPNAYGLVGAEANAIAPGKRPLSSMSPSLLVSADQTAIIGTPGGSRIITMVLLGILQAMQDKPVEDWVAQPRIHHQYLPDRIQYEPGSLTPDQRQQLQALGHQLKDAGRQYGNMQAIRWDHVSGAVTAAADPRGEGSAQVQPARNNQ